MVIAVWRREDMKVSLLNDGPVTILLESHKLF